MSSVEKYRNKIVFITGSRKNSGKTVYSNYLSSILGRKHKTVRLTIGIDGENQCSFYSTPKPAVYLDENNYVVSSEYSLRYSDAIFEYLDVFEFNTVLGRPAFAKTIRNGKIELAGPENNHQLEHIINKIKYFDYYTFIVDGALNRITQSGIFEKNALIIYVMMVDEKTINYDLDTLRKFEIYSKIKVPSNFNDDFYEIEGALTYLKLKQVPEDKKKIIVKDFTKIFISTPALKNLYSKNKIYFRKHFNIEEIIVNLKDITIERFEQEITELKIKNKIKYNPMILNRNKF
ncbi:MAG: hypothetical protein ACQESP_11325 [Candidatus Muiribacteriota bacterium]